MSFLTFTMVFLVLIAIVIISLVTQVDVHIPPSQHCSLSISAACHPPSDDVDSHLGLVNWGVVNEGEEGKAGHCTFTSYYVTKPVKDQPYT
jgi:hypothetical protein